MQSIAMGDKIKSVLLMGGERTGQIVQVNKYSTKLTQYKIDTNNQVGVHMCYYKSRESVGDLEVWTPQMLVKRVSYMDGSIELYREDEQDLCAYLDPVKTILTVAYVYMTRDEYYEAKKNPNKYFIGIGHVSK